MEDVGDAIPVEQWPRCDLCGGMPVVALQVAVLGHEVIFVAYCHGAEESVRFTLEEFYALEGITFGPAFTGPRTDPKGS